MIINKVQLLLNILRLYYLQESQTLFYFIVWIGIRFLNEIIVMY